MTVHALREFLVDCVAMGQAVAVLAFGNRRMLAFMTVNASQLAMFGGGLAQILRNIAVTGATESNRGIFRRA